MIGLNIVALFGKTSTCKTSFLCGLIGAQIAEVRDSACTKQMHFIRGVDDVTFQQLIPQEMRKSTLTVEDLSNVPDEKMPKRTVAVLPQNELWPKTRSACDAKDPRYCDLFVTGDTLAANFERVIPTAHHNLLHSAGVQFTVFNVDRLTSNTQLKRHLLNTIFVDTRGLDPSTSAYQKQTSSVGAQVLTMAQKNVYLLPAVSADNSDPAAQFEGMMMEATFGPQWFEKFQSYLHTTARNAAPLLQIFGGSAGAAAAGIINSSTTKQDSSSPKDKIDNGLNQLWKKTTFVRGKLDESLQQGLRGHLAAAQDAGMSLGYFSEKPSSLVRHFAIPEYAHQTAGLSERNELDSLRDELLAPNLGAVNDLCQHVAAFRLELKRKSSSFNLKSVLPRYVANTDDKYAQWIQDIHCPEVKQKNC